MPAATVAKKRDSAPDLSQAVANGVIRQLGTPVDFIRATAVNVYGNNYRVNVYQNAHVGLTQEARITDSFFVEVNDKGELAEGTIKRKYNRNEKKQDNC
jgi:hypothetical protein